MPGTGSREHDELDDGPADDARVGGFGLVTEFGRTFLITR